MIHQPMGGAQGQASDILISARHIEKIKKNMIDILSANTGQSVDKVERDVDRDYFMSAFDAKEYGIVDDVIEKR